MAADSDSESKLPAIGYIRELAQVFQAFELDEIEIETGDTRVLLRRSDTPAPVALPSPVAAPSAHVAPITPVAAPVEAPGDFITSPFVGTFYRAATPDAPAFVDVGDKVQPGKAVCIVEAMKLFNEIEAEFACTIEEVLIKNGQPVEYGAKLFRVRRL